jgi:propanediol dehydratase large subunit
LGLEVASGNDAVASHSEMRKSAKLMLQLIPGTDFVTSGYGAIPRYDNMFGGGNFDVSELDDWYALQRDFQVDGGIVPVKEEAVLQVRQQAVRALQSVFAELGFPSISDSEVAAAVTAYSSQDMPDRDRVADIEAARKLLHGPLTVLNVIDALERNGYREAAANILELQRQRVLGDYLQPSAIFDDNFKVISAISAPNDYQGPGTGYRVEGERWARLQNIPRAWDPRSFLTEQEQPAAVGWLEDVGPAQAGTEPEVVVALDPAFGSSIARSISGLDLQQVLAAVVCGVQEEGVPVRLLRVHHTADLAFVGHAGAKLSGSGVAVGIQSKGTTVIHHRDLEPLENLELFPQAPNLDLELYHQIGRNAALYATGRPASPVAVKIDNTARLRLIVQTTLMQYQATRRVDPLLPPTELRLQPRR